MERTVMSLSRTLSKATLLAAVALLSVAAAGSANAQSAPEIQLSYKNKKFDPAEISAPANTPIVIKLKNLDAKAMEFESKTLKVEKVVAGSSDATINVRAQKPGRYEFFDEYNEKSARAGLLVMQDDVVIAALIIVFREVFEAGLIIGIVLAVTRTVKHRNRWIGGGVLAGVCAACVVAAFAGALSNLFAGMGQELFNAAILTIAVVMLTWHNVWMARHGSELAGELRSAGQAVVDGSKSLLALAVVVGVAVLREGSEVVLFLYGVLAAGGDTPVSVALGGFSGVRAGGA